ncbi:MAG: methyltransferase domain-containing protein [Paracoccaceae bacterium]
MTEMNNARAGQVSMTAAEIYDARFVPALFGQFAPEIADALSIGQGEAVLDVGCGTGIAALAALGRVGPGGRVAAVDINPGMLAVARTKSDAVDWREAAAEVLPFDDASFDAVTCQFALMFLADRTKALREMRRVTKSGGRIGLFLWNSVENSPGYDTLVPLLGEVVGPDAADALAAPFCLGRREAVEAELAKADLSPERVLPFTGTAHHASLDDWIDTEIGGWTLAESVTEAQKERLKQIIRERLAHFVGHDGRVAFPAPAHLVIVRP